MRGGRIGIVGGSIAGCAVALAAARGNARIGRDQVVDAPAWSDLDPVGFRDWLAATMRTDTIGGRSLEAR